MWKNYGIKSVNDSENESEVKSEKVELRKTSTKSDEKNMLSKNRTDIAYVLYVAL